MTKKEFLRALEKELIYHGCEDLTSVIEYYDELIEDKKENGEKEKKVIDELSISDIVRNMKVEKRIEEATQKPTISNGMKALIAFLGILSFPMLITVGAFLFAMLIALLAVIFAVLLTFGIFFVVGIVLVPVLIGSIIIGHLPLMTAIFTLGVVLVLVGIFGMLVKWTIAASREIMIWFIDLINSKFRKRRENHE